MARAVFSLVLQLSVLCLGRQVLSAARLEDCVDYDVSDLEGYLNQLNLQDVPSTRSMTGAFKCPLNALPFGALKSDWSRLLLLQEAQPKQSSLRPKLDRLFRILAVAYVQMEENFDVTSNHRNSATNSSASRISKDSASNTGTSVENSIQEKKYPLSGEIAWKNLKAVGKEEALEAPIYPEGTSTMASSYRDPMGKMRRPQISRKPPSGMNEFWNYVVIPKRVVSPSTLAGIGPLSGRGDQVTALRGDGTTLAIHPSLNSNAQKIFRWFYNPDPDRGTVFDGLTSKNGVKGGCQARGKDKSCCS